MIKVVVDYEDGRRELVYAGGDIKQAFSIQRQWVEKAMKDKSIDSVGFI